MIDPFVSRVGKRDFSHYFISSSDLHAFSTDDRELDTAKIQFWMYSRTAKFAVFSSSHRRNIIDFAEQFYNPLNLIKDE